MIQGETTWEKKRNIFYWPCPVPDLCILLSFLIKVHRDSLFLWWGACIFWGKREYYVCLNDSNGSGITSNSVSLSVWRPATGEMGLCVYGVRAYVGMRAVANTRWVSSDQNKGFQRQVIQILSWILERSEVLWVGYRRTRRHKPLSREAVGPEVQRGTYLHEATGSKMI